MKALITDETTRRGTGRTDMAVALAQRFEAVRTDV